MKRYILSIGLLCFAAFGLQSCLDIDDPGDERGANEMELDGERNQGNADKIDFVKFASTPEMFDKVAAGLKQNLAQFVTGQYTMCGGKEGDMPSEHPYQRQFNLGPDNYVQYFTIPHKDFMYGTLTSTYNISNEFCGGELYGYTGAKNAYVPLLNHPLIDSIPEMKATALLYLSFIAQGAADLSGPMTYFEDKQNLEHPATYVSVERIYKNIVDNLNTIIQTYEAYETRPAWYQQKLKKLIEKNCQYFSMTSNKEVSELKKVANSLKLRMAMNITKVDPTLAKQWGEEAVASGVIEELSEQQAFYPMTQGKVHPLVTISETWGDTRLSASFESMLKSLNHPYLDYLFKPTSAKIGDLEI